MQEGENISVAITGRQLAESVLGLSSAHQAGLTSSMLASVLWLVTLILFVCCLLLLFEMSFSGDCCVDQAGMEITEVLLPFPSARIKGVNRHSNHPYFLNIGCK